MSDAQASTKAQADAAEQQQCSGEETSRHEEKKRTLRGTKGEAFGAGEAAKEKTAQRTIRTSVFRETGGNASRCTIRAFSCMAARR